jgi:hypothetical protein
MNTNRCASSCHCKCSGNNFNKLNHQNANQIVRLVDMNTQTESDDNTILYKPEETVNYELDFFDNLDRTLKVLSNSKNLWCFIERHTRYYTFTHLAFYKMISLNFLCYSFFYVFIKIYKSKCNLFNKINTKFCIKNIYLRSIR